MPVSDHVVDYAVSLVRATRPDAGEASRVRQELASPGAPARARRSTSCWAPRRCAVLHGRLNVSCDDVRAVARPVLRHRLFTNFNADSEGLTVEDVITHLLEEVKEPDERTYAGRAKQKGS